MSDEKIRCTYSKRKNHKYLTPDEVKVDPYKKEFVSYYWYWTSHEEEAPRINLDDDMHSATISSHQEYDFDMHLGESSGFPMESFDKNSGGPSNIPCTNYEHVNRYQRMVCDAASIEFGQLFEQNVEEPPNMDAARFYHELLNSAQQPLWLGCENHFELSTALRMLSLNPPSRTAGKCKDRWLDDREIHAVQLHVLLNCDKVKPYLE